MKTALVVVATFGLSLATAFVVAQTTPPPPAMPAPPTSATGMSAPMPPPPPMHKDASTPPGAMQHANAMGSQAMMPTSFATLDTAHLGYLTMDAAHNDPWLSKNFGLCDADHDSQVSSSEYSVCSTHGQ